MKLVVLIDVSPVQVSPYMLSGQSNIAMYTEYQHGSSVLLSKCPAPDLICSNQTSSIPAVIGTPTKDKSSNFGPSIISERRPKIINIVNHWIGINWDGGNLSHDFHPPAAPSQLARRGTAGRCGEFMLISADGWETGLRTLYLYWSSSVLNE